MRPYKIYKYTFPNGKVYIGMTKNTLTERRDMGYQHNIPLKTAIKEYGWNGFEHEILADNLTKEEAEKIEIEYIERYDSTNCKKGYNISKGGSATFSGLRHTEEYKRRMKQNHSGKIFSKEHIEKIRIAHEKQKKKVQSVDIEGNKKEYGSLHDAAKEINGHPTNISRACKSNKNYKGLKWQFAK